MAEMMTLPFRRGTINAELARFGLVAKSLCTRATVEVQSEVRSVFKDAMVRKTSFPFKFLQPVGGGCKSLFDPHTSSSFEWGARDVVQSAGHGAIYILAEDDLVLPAQVEEPEHFDG